MKLKTKHICLALALISVVISPLFFATLKQVNKILANKPGDFWISTHSDCKRDSSLSIAEFLTLKEACRKLQTPYIRKSKSDIYFEIYGFLNSRGGIVYCADSLPHPRYRHLTGKWYY